MKAKRVSVFMIVVSLVATIVSVAAATTYNTVPMDSTTPTGFASDENLGTDNGRTFYLTWDSTYVYVGVTGINNYYNDSVMSEGLYIAFDIDPNTTSSGATAQFGGMQWSGSTKGRPDVVFFWENGVCKSGENPKEWRNVASGTGWGSDLDVSSYGDYIGYSNTGTGSVKWRIPWEDVDTSTSIGNGGGFTPGSGNPIGVYIWVFQEGTTSCPGTRQVLSTMPTGNPTGDQPQTATHRILYTNTGTGVAPNSFPGAPTAVTLNALTAAPALPLALPVAGVIVALGGLGGLVAWRWRKR